MQRFTTFMEHAIICSKSELQAMIIDLDTIRQNLVKIDEQIPSSPVDLKIKERLRTAREKCLAVQAIIQATL